MNDLEAPGLWWRHMAFGWWTLLLFLCLGMLLEAMHGLKLGFYLDVSNATRRLMWTLAHAHGALLGLVHIVFAHTVRPLLPAGNPPAWARFASACLIGASVLLPGGFFLGGLVLYRGDPGMGVFLSPLGGLLLAAGVLLTALNLRSGSRG